MKYLRYLSVVLVALTLAACSGDAGNRAPDVSFTDLDGQTMTTTDLRGKVVLVKFWATDCTTCIAQMPDTIRYHNQLSAQGYETIAVAMRHDPEEYVRNFTRSRQLPFHVVLDSDGSLAEAFGNVKMTPTTFVIDKKGHIIKRYLGNYDGEQFLATVRKALAG